VLERAIVSGFDRIAEEKIRQAMAAGEFDQLSGKGKPLNLQENPYEPEGWGTAFRLIQQNGFSLPWIEAGLEIERERLQAHRLLRCACRESDPATSNQAHERFAHRIERLNQEIKQYNLHVPALVFQRHMLDLDTERAAALSDRLCPPGAESQVQD
jgi:DnaJ family protein C protein 28